ncbi:hypothetical protein M413DRAFT_442399 [Hebeloma cylindrosporum]|uniref:Uncharacterized protein n=1 Tax=Hebeloma cylindrosporum TaxID=76867 RepID=A0A0C3CJY9_HEBCY|nr:hypothetical protein M413DRAFT_442399 [Hebeloma cylindrosporum h7]
MGEEGVDGEDDDEEEGAEADEADAEGGGRGRGRGRARARGRAGAGDELDMVFDDPEDDGRGLVSAAWGTGHDGSAIEIVGVEFVERGTAHTACGLGRRNRAQRLLEYAERRSSILGQPSSGAFASFAAAATASTRLAGRKRRRGWEGWPVQPNRRISPNATVLDVVHEVDEEEEALEEKMMMEMKMKKKMKRDEEEEGKMMDVRTMVFGMGVSGDLRVGFKYTPTLLKEILFPSSPRISSSSQVDVPHPRKRRRIQQQQPVQEPTEDVEMAVTGNNDRDATPPKEARSIGDQPTLASPSAPPPVRPVILETAKETYLLSPSVLTVQGRAVRAYDIALVLETEVVVEDQEDQVIVEKNTEEALVVDGDGEMVLLDEEAAAAAALALKDALIATTKETSEPPRKAKSDLSVLTPLPASSSSSTPPPPLVRVDDAAAAIDIPAPAPSEEQSLDTDGPLVIPKLPIAANTDNNGDNTNADNSTMLIDDDDDDDIMVNLNPTKPHGQQQQFVASAAAVQLQTQVLQRGLGVEMFRFAEDGVYVLDGVGGSGSASASGAASGGSAAVGVGINDGMETEWVISVKNWKWAPRGPSLRERI